MSNASAINQEYTEQQERLREEAFTRLIRTSVNRQHSTTVTPRVPHIRQQALEGRRVP